MSERAQLDGNAVVQIRAVTAAVREGAADALSDTREQLPPAFDLFFEGAHLVEEDAFLDAVGDRGDLSTDASRDATEATLRTLSESLTGGQAADLATYLPAEFEAWLVESAPGEGAAHTVDEFVRRAGVEDDVAAAHARAVLGVVAEAVSERELRNARKQLPDAFGELFE